MKQNFTVRQGALEADSPGYAASNVRDRPNAEVPRCPLSRRYQGQSGHQTRSSPEVPRPCDTLAELAGAKLRVAIRASASRTLADGELPTLTCVSPRRQAK